MMNITSHLPGFKTGNNGNCDRHEQIGLHQIEAARAENGLHRTSRQNLVVVVVQFITSEGIICVLNDISP